MIRGSSEPRWPQPTPFLDDRQLAFDLNIGMKPERDLRAAVHIRNERNNRDSAKFFAIELDPCQHGHAIRHGDANVMQAIGRSHCGTTKRDEGRRARS